MFTSIIVFLLAVLYLLLVRGGREAPEALGGGARTQPDGAAEDGGEEPDRQAQRDDRGGDGTSRD